MSGIILYDGICNFCNYSVQFIIKRDRCGYFKFASLQSDVGKRLLNEYRLSHNINSFVYIDSDKCYLKSTAALKVSLHLDGAWKFLYLFRIIPTPIRDLIYHVIAKNRYRWFGQKESCILPTVDERKRFLD
ncbi:thiol-disulfide oxidoreductase DCC family protein [Alkalihalobacillus sp. BA299]|uniref:thiol-disulfide oxidoreductase DCC family protein n=1 Tax=Alkalihalobacillus sp. BA299 TaxID=2815938 RepID=UPI001AD9A73F|nr:thiol-disulfide oxidoreductase DCC family protein [Alkalihalobacillus sp. BA299]